MKRMLFATMVLALFGGVAGISAEDLRMPAECKLHREAKADPNGWADRVIHSKTGIELILVPAGDFVMGDDSANAGSHTTPAHRVAFERPFYVGRTEVTNAQYRRFLEATGYEGAPDTDAAYDLCLRHFRGKSVMSAEDNHPVVWVSWKNAGAFCDWAGLALPSEAQWEYACRAGSTSRYYYGNDPNDFGDYGWALTNSEATTHTGAQKKPNAWGLYDMLGNVWEWCEDDYLPGYGGAPTDGSARVEGMMTRVLRGGSWSNSARPVTCSSLARFNSAPENASNDVGFRVVLPLR